MTDRVWELVIGAILTVVTGVTSVIGVLVGIAWKSKPSRDEMHQAIDNKIEAHHKNDIEQDNLLIAPILMEQKNLRGEVMRMHSENREALKNIDGKLDRVIERIGEREKGH